jgi:histidinol-phosphate/aromatic aminotransferase/cobyric acid decarboxylase-like protein
MIAARPEVIATPLAAHGGPAGRADESARVCIDFSVCLNAFGPADVVRRAVAQAPVDRYPDPECLAPRRAAAARWDRPLQEIAVGAGSAELIHAVCAAFIRAGDVVLVPAPGFAEYERAARLYGARVVQIATPHGDRGAATADRFCAGVRAHGPRLVFVCTPANPTGACFDPDAIAAIASACAACDALLILDQAYDAFSGAPLGTPALPGHPAVLHLRSITKDHALAGVRAAFAVAPPEVLAALAQVRVPWSVSAAAQAAAAAALTPEAEGHVRWSIAQLRSEASRLAAACITIGAVPLATGTHYFLARVGQASALAERLHTYRGIKVRDCTSFGLPDSIRVAARTPADGDELIDALRRFATVPDSTRSADVP